MWDAGSNRQLPDPGPVREAALSGVELVTIIIRCELHDAQGRKVADGVGARAVKQDYGDLNKALKMAAKSSMIDATLRLAGLSEVFTQDLEDMPMATIEPEPPPPPLVPQKSPITEAVINEQQHRLLEAEITAKGLDRERVKAWVSRAWSIQHLNLLPARNLSTLLTNMTKWSGQQS